MSSSYATPLSCGLLRKARPHASGATCGARAWQEDAPALRRFDKLTAGGDFNFDDITSGEDANEAADDSGSIEADDAPVVRFFHKMIVDAVNMRASDLHFEPY